MKFYALLIPLFFLASEYSFAQKDTVYVRGYFESGEMEGTLNNAIDSVRSDGDISNTVFFLTTNERYVLDRSIVLTSDEDLEIIAPKPFYSGEADPQTIQKSAPPQIIWATITCSGYPSECDREINREFMIRTYGDLTLRNVWLRAADTKGNQIGTSITFEDDSLDTGLNPDKEKGYFDGVIFEYFPINRDAAGAVTVKTDHFTGSFKNSYFRNLTDITFKYYGRAVSYPFQSTGYHIDTLIFENTTFANLSRIIMMEGDEYVSNIHLNHVTLINSMEWPIQSGWYQNLSITNTIMVDPYMTGVYLWVICDEREDLQYSDYLSGECDEPYGSIFQVTPADSIGFNVDFEDNDRKIFIGNNSFSYSDSLKYFYNNNPHRGQHLNREDWRRIFELRPFIDSNTRAFIDSKNPEGKKLFPKMNIDTLTVYEGVDPDFIVAPSNRDSMYFFLMNAGWGCSCSTKPWEYKPEAGLRQQWPLPENMAYVNDTLLAAGMGGYPLGDLNWFPELKAQWDVEQRTDDWVFINNWLERGNALGVSNERTTEKPVGFSLEQNYPNPFNPTTNINFTIPEPGLVSLKVYDLLGREVATLVNGRIPAGQHSYKFDASALSSGVYMYHLQTGEFISTKKMLLIK